MTQMPSTTINRRRFVCLGTQAALGVGAAGMFSRAALTAEQPSAPATKPDFPIVDTHQHLWDMSKVRQSWLTPGGPLTRNFVMKDYLEAAAGLNIVRAVYMEVDVDADSQLAEAEYVLDICRRGGSPTVAAVIGGCPGEDSFKAYIARFKGSPFIKGVRQIPRAVGGQSPYRQKRFIESIRLLGEWAMRFDLCPPPAGLPDAIQLVDHCPGTQFILDHCGNADPKWYRARTKTKPPTLQPPGGARRSNGGGISPRWRSETTSCARFRELFPKRRRTLGCPTIWPPSSTTA